MARGIRGALNLDCDQGVSEEYEVAVVGAGPAGAATALALAAQGRSVLLVDKRAFPRDKACGDAIPARAIAELEQLGLASEVRAAGFYPIHNVRLFPPSGRSVDIRRETSDSEVYCYIAPRFVFDSLLVGRAIAAGSTFLVGQVRDVVRECGHVVGLQAEVNGQLKYISSRVVIGADGAASIIARRLGRASSHNWAHYGIGVRGYISDFGVLPNTLEMHFCKDLLPGYAWIFPVGQGKVNVGIGVTLSRYRRNKLDLPRMLEGFIQSEEVAGRVRGSGKLERSLSWILGMAGPDRLQLSFDGAVLVGDAARLVNPVTGGGIGNALVSARLAAQVVEGALSVGDVSRARLSAYEKLCERSVARRVRRLYAAQYFLSSPLAAEMASHFFRVVRRLWNPVRRLEV